MAVREDGAFAGSVSGGCVETAVISEAQEAIADGKHRNLSFGVSNEDAWAVGLACGGTIEVHVAPVLGKGDREKIATLAQARAEKRSCVLATRLGTGESRIIFAEDASMDALGEAVLTAARRDQSGAVAIGEDKWFLTVINPPIDLAIIGAVHIAQPLAAMAKLAGHDVRVIDPRERFASEERFPGVALVHEWPDEALARTPLNLRSAVVALTHDPKLDDPALQAALKSPAFYIGALGSRQTHARRLQRLREAGFSDADMARIKGPIGLDIGARSPAEIAIAILGEITRTLRFPAGSA
jgi:xanthine dehydrogenase accessory factor